MSRTNSASSPVSPVVLGEDEIQTETETGPVPISRVTTTAPPQQRLRKQPSLISTTPKSSLNIRQKRTKPRTLTENFKQQTLPAWRPAFTATKVSPLLFILGIIFVPAGVGLWIYSDNIQEIRIPYTDCLNTLHYPNVEDPNEDFFNKSCSDVIDSPHTALNRSCSCRIKFNITEDMNHTVYMYYALTDFYQNHRLYISSRDDAQLRGNTGTVDNPKKPSKDCDPFDYPPDSYDTDGKRNEGEDRLYYPCGAIANSMFSDEIRLYYNITNNICSKFVEVPLNRTGISWESDRNHKFINPCWFSNLSSSPELQRVFVKPKYWKKNLWELDTENPENNGVQNEDFIVWMRAAALPNFRKLYRILNREHAERREFAHGLPKGEYLLEIDYNFPVKSFKGTKSIILTTTSRLGGSNSFLGITYVIVGIVCLVLGIFTLFVHVAGNRRSKSKVVHID